MGSEHDVRVDVLSPHGRALFLWIGAALSLPPWGGVVFPHLFVWVAMCFPPCLGGDVSPFLLWLEVLLAHPCFGMVHSLPSLPPTLAITFSGRAAVLTSSVGVLVLLSPLLLWTGTAISLPPFGWCFLSSLRSRRKDGAVFFSFLFDRDVFSLLLGDGTSPSSVFSPFPSSLVDCAAWLFLL